MRGITTCSGLVLLAACRLGEYTAPPPGDGDADDSGPAGDAATTDGGDPADAPDGPHGLHAMIGVRPEITGSCDALDDRDEMSGQFAAPVQEQDVVAGWEFDTGADSYDDPSYGFDPAWPSPAQSGRFSVRFRGRITLDAGPHCFSIDIGATGTDIIGGKNACGQLWIADNDAPLAETGYLAATAGAATGCFAPAESGAFDFDIVFWYFNIFEQAKLEVRECAGAACTPDEALGVPRLQPS
jgi:hypothetical protein